MAKQNAVEFKIEGIDELIKTFESLSNDIQYKSGRSAMRKVSEEMIFDLTKNAPVGETGNLADAIQQSPSVKEIGGNLVAFAKVKYGSGGGNHAHLVELGHALVKGKGLGRKTIKPVPAYPFMKPTLYNGRQKWEKIIVQGVEKALNKLKKKGAF